MSQIVTRRGYCNWDRAQSQTSYKRRYEASQQALAQVMHENRVRDECLELAMRALKWDAIRIRVTEAPRRHGDAIDTLAEIEQRLAQLEPEEDRSRNMENKLKRECHHCGTVYTIDFERMVAYYKFTVSHWRYCPMCGHDIREAKMKELQVEVEQLQERLGQTKTSLDHEVDSRTRVASDRTPCPAATRAGLQ